VNVTGWSRGLEVTGGGIGVVSHAGMVLLRQLADRTGLAGGLSRALASDRLLVHDRGRVLADLACGRGRRAGDQRFPGDHRSGAAVRPGRVGANVLAGAGGDRGGGERTAGRVSAAVSAARREAWAAAVSRHGALPGVCLVGSIEVQHMTSSSNEDPKGSSVRAWFQRSRRLLAVVAAGGGRRCHFYLT